MEAPFFGLLFFLVVRVLPVIIGALLIADALRQRARLVWPTVGLAIMAIVGGGAKAAATFSLVPEVQSELSLGIGLSTEDGVRIAVMFALMLAPLLARRRLTQPPA